MAASTTLTDSDRNGASSGTAPTIGGRMAATADRVSSAAGAAANAASDAAARLPDLADRGRAVFVDANRQIQAESDEMLTAGTALSFGFAMGLLLGGANRVLVTAALVPVAMMGLTLLDRAANGRLRTAGPPTKAADR